MLKGLYRCLSVVLVVQFIALPAIAQSYDLSGMRFQRPFSGDYSSGTSIISSFRSSGLSKLGRLGMGTMFEQELRAKSMMMTQPSLSGLTYQVHILGEVKRPGTYRVAASDRLSEVLFRAGGVDEQGSRRRIEVRRKGERTKVVDLMKFQLFGDLSNNPFLLDNDVVYVPLCGKKVEIVGPVKRPRKYELVNERTLYDLVQLAGGFTVGLSRADTIKVIRFVNDKKRVIAVETSDSATKGFELMDGDIVVVPHVILHRHKFDYNVAKLPGDNIFYPSYEDRVFVLGGVYNPGPYLFSPYYTIDNYITMAGGRTPLGRRKVTVIRADGTRVRVTKKNLEKLAINPGDTIKVARATMQPHQWTSFIMGVMSFALSTTTTILVLTR